MQRGPILLLVLLLGIGGFALAYKALQTEELTPEQQPQSRTPANKGATPTAEPTPDVIGAPPTSKRAKRIQERIADMMPSPDKRDRRRVPTSEETAEQRKQYAQPEAPVHAPAIQRDFEHVTANEVFHCSAAL